MIFFTEWNNFAEHKVKERLNIYPGGELSESEDSNDSDDDRYNLLADL